MHCDKTTEILTSGERDRKMETQKKKMLYTHNCFRFLFYFFRVVCCTVCAVYVELWNFMGPKRMFFLFISYCRFCVSLILTSLSSCFAEIAPCVFFLSLYLFCISLPFTRAQVHRLSLISKRLYFFSSSFLYIYFARTRARWAELIRFALPSSSSFT